MIYSECKETHQPLSHNFLDAGLIDVRHFPTKYHKRIHWPWAISEIKENDLTFIEIKKNELNTST